VSSLLVVVLNGSTDIISRKATSLIRQFDRYTPIISMTSNAQPQDVDSYLQSGMNDVLAKPFTKYGLFGILEKHLIHLKAIQLSTEIPISLGLPPLSDQGVVEAVMNGVNWNADTSNPLASMGWSDDTYQLILQVSYSPL
jgi:osomolarity two-component system response regulator SKN7